MFSVIIPTFNEENTLKNCLRSIDRQEHHNYEVVIVDGDSTDKTLQIATSNGAKVYKIPKRRLHDVGLARNYGANFSEGEILVFIDADMIIPSNFLSAMETCFQNPDVTGAICNFLPWEGNCLERVLYECNNTLMKASLKTNNYLLSYFSCTSYRKDSFMKVGGFREDLNACEDYDLALRVGKQGRIKFTAETTVYVSPRRLREWTYTGYIARYLKYLFQYHVFNQIYDKYEVIR